MINKQIYGSMIVMNKKTCYMPQAVYEHLLQYELDDTIVCYVSSLKTVQHSYGCLYVPRASPVMHFFKDHLWVLQRIGDSWQ